MGLWTGQTILSAAAAVVNSALYVTGQELEIEVDDGEYQILDKWVVLSGLVHLYSKNGAEATILKAANPEAYRRFKKFIDLSYGTFAIVVCEHRNLICIKIKRKKCKNGMKNDTVLRKSSYLCIVKRQVGI